MQTNTLRAILWLRRPKFSAYYYNQLWGFLKASSLQTKDTRGGTPLMSATATAEQLGNQKEVPASRCRGLILREQQEWRAARSNKGKQGDVGGGWDAHYSQPSSSPWFMWPCRPGNARTATQVPHYRARYFFSWFAQVPLSLSTDLRESKIKKKE